MSRRRQIMRRDERDLQKIDRMLPFEQKPYQTPQEIRKERKAQNDAYKAFMKMNYAKRAEAVK